MVMNWNKFSVFANMCLKPECWWTDEGVFRAVKIKKLIYLVAEYLAVKYILSPKFFIAIFGVFVIVIVKCVLGIYDFLMRAGIITVKCIHGL